MNFMLPHVKGLSAGLESNINQSEIADDILVACCWLTVGWPGGVILCIIP